MKHLVGVAKMASPLDLELVLKPLKSANKTKYLVYSPLFVLKKYGKNQE